MSATECAGLSWVEPKAVAAVVGVSPGVVWSWCRAELVLARRLPGRRGRLRVRVDGEGFPVPGRAVRLAGRPAPPHTRPRR